MERRSLERAAELLRSISHPVRIRIIEMLAVRETCFCDLQADLQLEQSSLSQHLQVLRRVGLVASRKRGSQTWYRLLNRHLPHLIEVAMTACAAGTVTDADALIPLDR